MSVKERLKEFIKFKNISQRSFEESVGLSNGYINNISNSISHKKIEDITAVYPELNPSWLLLGEGGMFKGGNYIEETESSKVTIERFRKYLNSKGMELLDAAPILGVSRRAFYSALEGKGRFFNEEVTRKSIKSFPDLNFEWLLTGEGSMIKDFYTKEEDVKIKEENAALKEISNLNLSPGLQNTPFYRWLEFMIEKKKLDKDLTKGHLSKHVESPKSSKGDTQPIEGVFIDIQKKHPELNIDWLLTGEGPMVKDEHEMEIIKREDGTEFRHLGHDRYLISAPLIRKEAFAVYKDLYSDQEFLEELPRHVVAVDNLSFGVYKSFENIAPVLGDRIIEPGDIVTGRRIEKSTWKQGVRHSGLPAFVIVHDKGILITILVDHDVLAGELTYSGPDNEYFPENIIKIENVLELYNIISVSYQLS